MEKNEIVINGVHHVLVKNKKKGEYIMKRLNLDKHLKKHKHYATLARTELDHIGSEIKKYIDWDSDITIEETYRGLWVSNAYEEIVPLYTAIEIIEEKGVLSEADFNLNKFKQVLE